VAARAVVICPGGGYRVVGTSEGWPVARVYEAHGYKPFVLHYSVGDHISFDPERASTFRPFIELGSALRLIEQNAGTLGCAQEVPIVAGFSAGGHLAAGYCIYRKKLSAGSQPNVSTSCSNSAEYYPLPPALALTYPAVSFYGSGLTQLIEEGFPPVFLIHGKNDMMVPFESSVRFDEVLTEVGIPHVFMPLDNLPHTQPLANPAWQSPLFAWLCN